MPNAETMTAISHRSERATDILEVAAKLFYENDYNSVGMRLIAQEAGVRSASLYHHFSSKEQMLYQIVLGVTRDFIADRLPILEIEDQFSQRLGDLVEQHILYFWENRVALQVGFREMHNLLPDHYADISQHRLRYQRRIQEFIQAGKTAGVFTCDDPRLAGMAILDMVNGINNWFVHGRPLSIEELAKKYRQLVLASLGEKK
jgi:AcrR family transcriptional regulator